jgi:hypothetical protein
MPHRIAITAVAVVMTVAVPAAAQTYSAGADLLFYGDNTEFANPFRSGETTLGVSGRVFMDATLNDAVTLRAGFFGLGRFGAHEALEHAEPLVALRLSRGASQFVFGSLDTIATRHDVLGPDEETLHRLLPPLQEETLTFRRGQEMGLQWIVDAKGFTHDAWIDWQRLNTERHRERFDAGYRSAIMVSPRWQLHGQWHVVHEGGQRFTSGPVRDSQAAALGARWSASASQRVRMNFEGHLVGTHDVPNRAERDGARAGLGVFTRAGVEYGPWRSHLIVWRGGDVLKEEGDPNYLARRRDGTRFRKIRDYAELGLTRHFRPAPGVHMFAAVRIHRTESAYEYSYRIVSRVRLRHVF